MAARTLTPVWVEVGPNGAVIARVVVDDPRRCPAIELDKDPAQPMKAREPVPAGLMPACEFSIPPATKSAKANGQLLALPVSDPQRITVIGDTGCRLKGARVQACNDPSAWPFAQIATTAAKGKPQLVMHVGDYLYREEACPINERGCKGSPSGDSWDTWNADFFKPAKELLKAAPWLMARGNHESCARAWHGWFYYFDPRPMVAACVEYSPAYMAKLGSFQVVVLDSSAVNDANVVVEQVAKFRDQLKPFSDMPAWLLLHHPFWGLKRAQSGATPLTETLQQAFAQAGMRKIGFILSGHTHLFELLSFSNGWPPQLVAGDGGTQLASSIGKRVNGTAIFGTTVKAGDAENEFGFVELTGGGTKWALQLKNKAGKALVNCQLDGNTATCPNH